MKDIHIQEMKKTTDLCEQRELETSKNESETEGQELQDKRGQLHERAIVPKTGK